MKPNWIVTAASWLIAMIGPVIVRVLAVLGYSAVIFTGVELSVHAVVDHAVASWGTLPVAVLQLATLSGVPEALGLIFGAYMSRFAVTAATGFAKWAFSGKSGAGGLSTYQHVP